MDTITHFRIKRMSPQFLVADIDRSIEFYTQKLGFDVDFRYEDFYAGIIKDGFSIHLKTGQLSVVYSLPSFLSIFECSARAPKKVDCTL